LNTGRKSGTYGERTMKTDWQALLKYDVPASVVVFLVALPLCMGIAIASGLPPAAGLITGVVGGLVVGWFSGAPLQVSGPAAGLVVLVYEIVERLGASGLAVVMVLAGLLQVTAGLLRLAAWFRAVSPAVIQGMLAGIGALILLGQVHVMLDVAPRASGVDNLAALPDTLWRVVAPDETAAHHEAAFVGLLTVGIIVLWQALLKNRVLVPGTLVAVVAASLIANALGWPVRYVNVPDGLAGAIRWLTWGDVAAAFDAETVGYVAQAAVAVAIIASAESLLCATAVDQLHHGPRTRYDRELLAQGVGNLLCAVLGGLPMTGVIARSGANVHAGARSRASAILHGFWLLAMVALLPAALTCIPVASLAGVLVWTGFKLIDPKAVGALWRAGRGEVLIYAATLGFVVFDDLLTGVLVGMALAGAKLLYGFSRLRVRLETDVEKRRSVLHLDGAATFVRLPRLAAALESVPADHELHVNVEKLAFVDHACLNLLTSWATRHRAQGGTLVIDWDSLHARFQAGSPARERVLARRAS
jgi:MFS superfamily sulfate permease-like transporter